MIPLLVVRYESLIGSYLGETAGRLLKLFDYAKTRECVLFFDEFETIGKERGDVHDTGEIKRVVSSLLMQIDSLPSYVIVIAATNHASLLDKAAWRRFQIRLDIPKPTRNSLEKYFSGFERQRNMSFGLKPSTMAKKTFGISFSDAEEIALAIYRQYILDLPSDDVKSITLIGFGALKKDKGDVFKLPLHVDFSSRLVKRKLTVTLAYISPIVASRQAYRKAQLWFEIDDNEKRLIPDGARQNSDWRAVRKGTLQHEIFVGENPVVWNDEDLKIKVNCTKDAANLKASETIPYCIFVSFEIADGLGIDLYSAVKTQIHQRVSIAQA